MLHFRENAFDFGILDLRCLGNLGANVQQASGYLGLEFRRTVQNEDADRSYFWDKLRMALLHQPESSEVPQP